MTEATMEDRPLPAWARWADGAVGVLLVVWAVTVAFGHRWTVGPIRLSLSPARTLGLAAAVVLARHLAAPRPAAHVLLRAWLSRALARRPALSAVLPIWIATRPLVLIVGLVAVLMIGYPSDVHPPRISTDETWNLPMRWDVGWYAAIASHGYQWLGTTDVQQTFNFFPALPLLMRAVAPLGGTHIPLDVRHAWGGTLLAMAAFLGALTYLWKLFREELGDDAATSGVVFIAAYPFAVFYSAAYTEGLYLLAVAGAFWHLRRDEVGRAGAWACLVGLTRPNGVMFALPLALAAYGGPVVGRGPGLRTDAQRRYAARFAVACMPILGMLIFSAYAYTQTGRPFVWAELQRAAWGRTFQGAGALSDLSTAVAQWTAVRSPVVRMNEALDGAAALFALVTLWPVTRRFGLVYGVYVAVGVLLPLANGGVEAMGRYTSVLFPSFMWLGLAVRPQHRAPLASAFAIGQAFAAVLFFTWRPLL